MIKYETYIRAAVLSLVLFWTTGCFREDYGFCPPEEIENNVRLDFRLVTGEVFKDNVTSVHVDIFDGNGVFLQTVLLDRAAIDQYAGMVLTLDPGDYRMVFWANVNGNTRIVGTDRVTYSHMSGTTPATTGNGDKVWYAPGPATPAGGTPPDYYTLRVPEGGSYSDVIPFTPAYRSVEVYIKGLSQDPATQPTVEITGLPAGHGYFGMCDLTDAPTTVDAVQVTSLVELENILYSAVNFDTPHFQDLEGIDVVIKDADGNVLYSISLADAIRECNADPDKITIRLVFSFINGNVEISIPGWSSGETGIEF